MDKDMAYAVLGIKVTKDEEQIRQAYHIKLEENHPEDDPEGFKRLRSAYEQALLFVREPEAKDEGEVRDDTPSGQWMRRIDQVYSCLPRRLSEEEWMKLLQEDICLDLEYGEEVKWSLFRYLADNYRLKSNIFRLLDRSFGIRENEREFKEHLPVGFVDYMLRRIADEEGDDDFPYEWLTGEDEADYDRFLSYLYDLEDKLEEGEFAQAQQIALAMEAGGIDHPYYAVSRLRLTLHRENHTEQEVQEALDEAGRLLKAYPESVKILLLCARELWDYGRKEEAASVFKDVAGRFGAYYIAEKYLVLYEKEQGDLLGARNRCYDAVRNWNDEELRTMLTGLDTDYIALCGKKQAEGTLALDEADQMCVSYLRTECWQEGLDFMLAHPEYTEKIEDAHRYLCLFYNSLGQFEDSLRESRMWREALLGREADKDAIALSYSYEGDALKGLAGQQEDDESAGAGYQAAKEAYEQASAYAPENLRMRQDLLDVLVLQEAYEDAVMLAEEILSKDEGWFPALVQKQKACYKLGRAQDVVDLFYEAKEIYAGYPPMYEVAARLFIDYRQYGDAESVLAQAKEAGVESFGLDVIALSCERRQAHSDIGYFDVLKKAEKLLEKFEAEGAKKQEIAALYSEMAVLEDCQYYEEFIHPGKAEEYIQKAIELGSEAPTEDIVDYYYICGRIMQRAGKYEEAIAAYGKFMEGWEITVPAAMNLGDCHNALGEWKKAVEYYEKALSIDPQEEVANQKIADIYKETGYDKDSTPLYRKALFYENRQIELTPESAYAYRIRGIIHMYLGELEEALADADEAIRLEKNNPYGLNIKGEILYAQKKYQQALFYYKKAVAQLDDSDYKSYGSYANGRRMYENAARCCKKMQDYAHAEEWYRKGIALFEDKDQGKLYWLLICLYYKDMGKGQEAMALLEESYGKGHMEEETYALRRLYIKEAACRSEGQARELEQEALEAVEKFGSKDVWEELSDIQYYYVQDMERALETKRKVMGLLDEENDWWGHFGTLLEWMRICWECADAQGVEECGRKFIQSVEGHFTIMAQEYPPVEQYLTYANNSYSNNCDMALYWIYSGQLGRAREILEKLPAAKWCRDCSACICTDFWEACAAYCEVSGDLEQAYQYYSKCLEKTPAGMLCYYKYVQLGRKLGYAVEE